VNVRGGDMSYKHDIKQQIEQSIKNSAYGKKRLTELIEDYYRNALYESKKTGQSVESMTYEILEGAGEGCLVKAGCAEEMLEDILDIISNTIQESAQEHIYRKKRQLYWAEKQLSETIETEQSYVMESIEACKAYAKEKSLKTLEERLQQYESKLSGSIYILADKIKYTIE